MSGRVRKPPAPRKKANGYKMPAPIANGEVIHDTIRKKKWRIGSSIGVGGFGEIYCACEDGSSKSAQYPFVVKIEPHENGPLFVENHFYTRNALKDDISAFMKSRKLSSLGMPLYFGNGTHEYKGEKYRYLVLERYGKDVWNLFLANGRSFPPVTVFHLGIQMLDVLEYIHSRGYVHADIKGSNILMGLKKGTENQAYLLDFGLATRVNDAEFKPSAKSAHNGTIEYTSRDAHLGVPTMRGDLEILGYNMLQWLVGELPWEHSLKQPKTVQTMKETFMNNVRKNITKEYSNVPDALIKFFEYINKLEPKQIPDHTKCRQLFESYLKSEGKTRNTKLDFSGKKVKSPKSGDENENDGSGDESENEVKRSKVVKTNGEVKVKKIRKPKTKEVEVEDCETAEPDENVVNLTKTKVSRKKKKSLEPSVVVKVKRTRMIPRGTPPTKKNHVNIATQTSVDKLRRSPRKVSFESPISKIIESKPSKTSKENKSANSSPDIFDDSITIEDKKVKKSKPKKKLIADEVITVKRVFKKKMTTTGKSWKDSPAIINGRSPPK